MDEIEEMLSSLPQISLATRLQVELRDPGVGGLGFRLVLDEFELNERASGVSNDPLEELIDMGLFLARGGSGMRRVCIWLEPEGFAVDAWNLGNELAQVLVSKDGSFVPPMSAYGLEEVSRHLVERTSLAQCIEEEVGRLLRENEVGLRRWCRGLAWYVRLHAELREELRRS